MSLANIRSGRHTIREAVSETFPVSGSRSRGVVKTGVVNDLIARQETGSRHGPPRTHQQKHSTPRREKKAAMDITMNTAMSTIMSTMTTPQLTVESAKRLAAYRAVDEHFPPHARHIGIGSGSTVVYVVERIAQLSREITDPIVFVPTGYQSRELILRAGLRLGSIDMHTELEVAFDGADEVDPYLNCIKGGGACLFQEKLVAVCAKKFVVVADYRKLSPSLSTHYAPGIPIEVVPLAATYVLARLTALGAVAPAIRMGGASKAGPCITDNGNFIIDAPFPDGFIPSSSSSSRLSPSKSISPTSSSIAIDASAVKMGGERVGGLELLGKEGGHPGAAVGMGVGGNEKVEDLARVLKGIVGVVDHGVFWSGDRKPLMAYFGMENGKVETRVLHS